MTIEYIRYTIPAALSAEFESAYNDAKEQLTASEHCLAFELSRCEEAPEAYILRIEWTSTKDHLEGFRKSEHFPPFLGKIRPFVDKIDEMRHYAVVMTG